MVVTKRNLSNFDFFIILKNCKILNRHESVDLEKRRNINKLSYGTGFQGKNN